MSAVNKTPHSLHDFDTIMTF